MEHFSAEYEDIMDPLTNIEMLTEQAKSNSKILYEIFKCDPYNEIRNFDQLREVRE